MILFWILAVITIIWALGFIVFIYHALSYRYPKDIMPGMLMAFTLVVIPLLILLIGYLSDLYGGRY